MSEGPAPYMLSDDLDAELQRRLQELSEHLRRAGELTERCQAITERLKERDAAD